MRFGVNQSFTLARSGLEFLMQLGHVRSHKELVSISRRPNIGIGHPKAFLAMAPAFLAAALTFLANGLNLSGIILIILAMIKFNKNCFLWRDA
jgi:hypothetical protein